MFEKYSLHTSDTDTKEAAISGDSVQDLATTANGVVFRWKYLCFDDIGNYKGMFLAESHGLG